MNKEWQAQVSQPLNLGILQSLKTSRSVFEKTLFLAAAGQNAKIQAQDLILRISEPLRRYESKPWQLFHDKIWVLIGTLGHRNLEWGYLGGLAENIKPQDLPEFSGLGEAAPPTPY